MLVFRIVHKKWSGTLKASGYPGRWNSAGIFILYTAESRALACLENLVHMGRTDPGHHFSCMVLEIPEDQVTVLEERVLSTGCRAAGEPGYRLCRPHGDRWISSSESLVLKIPSAIIPSEFNYLVNVRHPEFNKLRIYAVEPFTFDSRIRT